MSDGNGKGRTGELLARLTESARYLADLAGLLDKPVVTVEHDNPEDPGQARVVIALHDSYEACNDLLEFMQERYPNADIETIDVGMEGQQHGERQE